MKLFLFGLALFSMGTASASTIYLLNGQNFPYGDHTVSCGQPSFAKPCVIDLEKKDSCLKIFPVNENIAKPIYDKINKDITMDIYFHESSVILNFRRTL